MRSGSTLLAVLVLTLATGVPAFDLPDLVSPLRAKAFRHADLYIGNVSRRPIDLPAQAAASVQRKLSTLGVPPGLARVDVRSGRFGTLTPSRPLIPGAGVGNDLDWAAVATAPPSSQSGYEAAVWSAFVDFLAVNESELQIDPSEIESRGKVTVTGDMVQIHARRMIDGIPVRNSYVNAVVKKGNLILMGARNWGDVNLASLPAVASENARARLASHLAPIESNGEWKKSELVIVPMARGRDLNRVAMGQGYRYRLAWAVRPEFTNETGRWEALVDAHSGELILFEDTAHYTSNRDVVGGVYPVSNDGVGADGTEQSGWPMPFVEVTNGSSNLVSDAGGNLQCVDGSITTELDGLFVRIDDNCGAISATSSGDIDFGTSTGTDCATPGFGGAGNTHSARTGFHELNRIIQMAQGQLPGNAWLQEELVAIMNINNTCNAFYDGNVNFYRSGSGCSNTGEIAGVFDHEWGHGMDDNDATPGVSSPGEGIADIFTALRLDTSCIGRNFFQSGVCSGYGDPCTECSGVRDIDYEKRASGLPHDLAWIDANCPAASSNGPCGGGVHCEGTVYAEAVWDLWKRDLTGVDANTAHEIVNRLTFIGSGGVGQWFQCNAGSGTGDGCNADGGYLNFLAADDDDGNLNNGTPHMTAIFAAFDRHGIACSTPTPVDSGCSGAPSIAPVVTATPRDRGAEVEWTAVPDADRYQVFRTDGVHGCGFGKIKVGETTGTGFIDSGLQNGRAYSYIVMPVGTSDACLGPASSCVALTPLPGANIALQADSTATVVASTGDGDMFLDNCETADVDFTLVNTGNTTLTNVRIVGAEPVSHPQVALTDAFPKAVSTDALACGLMNTSLNLIANGLSPGDTLELRVDVTSDEIDPKILSKMLVVNFTESDFDPAPVFSFESGLQDWEVVQGTFDRSSSGGGASSTSYYVASSNGLPNQCDQIRSPLLRLASDSTLSLHTLYDIEPRWLGLTWYDRANLGIVDDVTGSRTPVNPDGGRLYNASGANGTCGTTGQNGWADGATSWAESTWSAGALGSSGIAGDLVRLDIRYGTDPLVHGFGFRFDQVTLTNAEVQVADAQTDTCDVSIDADSDGVLDLLDNCPGDANGNQLDFDGDSSGDACDADDDNDGLTDQYETDNELDPFDPDIDGDGIMDGLDDAPETQSNLCSGTNAVFENVNIANGQVETCAATSSVQVESTVDINSGGTAKVFSPTVNFMPEFGVPVGAELRIYSRSPMP